jgi:hypothetical protein
MAENISTVNAEGAIVDNPKLEQVFSSIEKQLIAQTGFLKSMQSLQADQFRFNKDMVKKTEAERRRESVSQADGSNLSDSGSTQSNVTAGKGEDLSNGISGLLASALSALGGVTLGGLVGGLLKKTLPAIMAPIVGSFVGGAVEEALKQFGADDKTAAVIGDSAKTGVEWAIWGKLLFGKWGGIAGLLAGVGSHLGTIMDTNQDGIVDGILGSINSDPAFWNNWGALIVPAVTGILYLLGKKLGVVIASMGAAALTAALARMKGVPVPTPGAPGTGPGATTATTTTKGKGASAYKPGQFALPEMQKGGATSTLQTLPSGMRTNSAGKVIDAKTGRFKSAADVIAALEADPSKAGKLAKYAKFLKFAGPAAMIIPALINPLMAIHNDEPPDVIRTEIIKALGSVSGAYLGGIAGAAGATMIPIVGQSGIGNLLGGVIGAVGGSFAGEYLAEEIADALMGGPPPEAQYNSSDPESYQFDSAAPMSAPAANDYGNEGRRIGGLAPSASTAPQITPVIPMAGKVSAITGMQSASATGTGAGVNVNNLGGNVSNNTNVGGSSTTYNIFQSSGSSALSNSLPVPMAN